MKKIHQHKRVLVTGAGGPAAVSFMNALQDPNLVLHAGDIDPYAPGLYLVPRERRHLLRRGNHPAFVVETLGLCQAQGIDILVPTVDSELQPLARAKKDFLAAGIEVLCPSESTLALCLDKWELLQACSLDVPVPKSELFTGRVRSVEQFPCIVKPRTGSGSRGVIRLDDLASFVASPRSPKLLLQEYLPGEEYSVDIYVGASGTLHAAVPRQRLKVDSGVAITSRTVNDPKLIALAGAVARAITLRGVANVQFRRDRCGIPRLLEVNPRFAGAMSLTVHAGANIPQMAIDEILGRPLPAGMVSFEVTSMTRTFRDTYVPVEDIAVLEKRLAEQEAREDQAPAALRRPIAAWA